MKRSLGISPKFPNVHQDDRHSLLIRPLSSMQRLSRFTCLFCEFTTFNSTLKPRNPTHHLTSKSLWSRRYLSVQSAGTRRPSRMELSPDVARSRIKPKQDGGGKPKGTRGRDSILGPFRGMNRTSFKIPEDELQQRMKRQGIVTSKFQDDSKRRKPPREDYKALKMQQALSHVGYGKRSSIKKQISTVTTFEEFRLSPQMQENVLPCALPDIGDAVPTPIQRLAIPVLMDNGARRRAAKSESVKQFLLAAETGSGKTLAYLVPVIDAIKQKEAEDSDKPEESASKIPALNQENPDIYALESLAAGESKYPQGRPRAIVLVPTSELVDQVGRVAKSFSHKIKFRACLISSAYSPTIIRNRLSNPGGIDLLVTTPQLLASIAKSNPAILSRVSHLVIDEADSLLDRSFEEFTTSIVERAEPTLKQLIMCSATIPRRMDNYLRKRYPDIVRLTTPNLHAIPRRVQLSVVDVDKNNYFGNKNLACADTIWKIGQSANELEDSTDESTESEVRRIMVFVNEREQTAEVAQYLQAKGIDAIALNRDADARQELDLLSEFKGETPKSEKTEVAREKKRNSQVHKQLENTRVVVVTDLASRGIDTTSVRDVILYDVPHTSIDFIHRLGRTGRMGRRGRGFVLVGRADRKDIVSEVRHGMYRGQALI